jgi:hypothetical protein
MEDERLPSKPMTRRTTGGITRLSSNIDTNTDNMHAMPGLEIARNSIAATNDLSC